MMEAHNKKGIKQICYNCIYRGNIFKIDGLSHCHCEHPNKKVSGDKTTGWDTLRTFWDTCDSFKTEKRLMIKANLPPSVKERSNKL